MSAVHCTLDQLQAGLKLGRLTFIIFKAQRRIAADLAQSGKFCQNLQFVLIKFLRILSGNLLFHMNHLSVIYLLLRISQTDISEFLQFFRKILQYVFFQPSQDKWSHHFLQTLHGFFIVVFYDRVFHFFSECIIGVKEAGHQIVKNTPKLAQPVLNRRTRQCVADSAVDHLHCLCGCCSMVFDILRLINDLVIKFLILVKSNITLQ